MNTTIDTLQGRRIGNFIDGRFVEPASGEYAPSFDPTTARPWYEFAQSNEADVDAAVRSSRAALKHPSWRRMTQTERGKLVRRLG